MEEGLEKGSLLAQIHRAFGGEEIDIRTYSPLTLAYIGDAVFEMIVRTLIVEKGQRAANTLHKHTTKIVCAQTQAQLIDAVYESLTEEEQDIYRRGKIRRFILLQKMPVLQITERLQDLRRSADIFS